MYIHCKYRAIKCVTPYIQVTLHYKNIISIISSVFIRSGLTKNRRQLCSTLCCIHRENSVMEGKHSFKQNIRMFSSNTSRKWKRQHLSWCDNTIWMMLCIFTEGYLQMADNYWETQDIRVKTGKEKQVYYESSHIYAFINSHQWWTGK